MNTKINAYGIGSRWKIEAECDSKEDLKEALEFLAEKINAHAPTILVTEGSKVCSKSELCETVLSKLFEGRDVAVWPDEGVGDVDSDLPEKISIYIEPHNKNIR